jgi:hypothetical protein
MSRKSVIERTVRNYLTSLVGLAIMTFSALYFWKNIDDLTLENVLVGSALGAVGFIFLWVKDNLITSFLPKR